MVANPLYFRGLPKLQKIVYKIVPDRNTVLSQLESHELDMWYLFPGNYLQRVQGVSGYDISRRPSYYYNHMDFNVQRPAMRDLAVRQAIRLALNRPRTHREDRAQRRYALGRFDPAVGTVRRHFDTSDQIRHRRRQRAARQGRLGKRRRRRTRQERRDLGARSRYVGRDCGRRRADRTDPRLVPANRRVTQRSAISSAANVCSRTKRRRYLRREVGHRVLRLAERRNRRLFIRVRLQQLSAERSERSAVVQPARAGGHGRALHALRPSTTEQRRPYRRSKNSSRTYPRSLPHCARI